MTKADMRTDGYQRKVDKVRFGIVIGEEQFIQPTSTEKCQGEEDIGRFPERLPNEPSKQ